MRYSRILHLLSSYRTESSTYRPREESFLVSQDLHRWTKLLREEINDAVRGFEKSQHIWGKNKFNYMDLAGKGRNSVHHYNHAHRFVPMKRSQESSSPNFLWRWKQAHVVSSRGTAYLWDNFVWGNLEKGEYEMLSSVKLRRKMHEIRMWFWSANFGNRELRMVQKTLEMCLSQTHASGNREAQTKDLSSQTMLNPDEKATMEKEWKEVTKKAHKNIR